MGRLACDSAGMPLAPPSRSMKGFEGLLGESDDLKPLANIGSGESHAASAAVTAQHMSAHRRRHGVSQDKAGNAHDNDIKTFTAAEAFSASRPGVSTDHGEWIGDAHASAACDGQAGLQTQQPVAIVEAVAMYECTTYVAHTPLIQKQLNLQKNFQGKFDKRQAGWEIRAAAKPGPRPSQNIRHVRAGTSYTSLRKPRTVKGSTARRSVSQRIV